MTLRRRPGAERQLDKELRFHVDEHTRDLIARGVDPAEARRQALLAIGGVEQIKEECRDVRATRWLHDLAQDLRYAWRMLAHAPGFTFVALLTLGLGTGATTVMFTLVNGVLLRPLPYASPDRLVKVHGHSETWNTTIYGEQNLSYPDFLDARQQVRSMELAGWMWDTGTLSAPGDADHVVRVSVSANLFSLLGLRMAQGRDFRSDEDRAGGVPVAILTDPQWRQRFGASPSAIGATVVLDTISYTVVGVLPPNTGVGDNVDIYTLLGQNTLTFLTRRGPHPINVAGRLHEGATLAQARNELSLVGSRLASQYPDTNKDRSFIAGPMLPYVGDVGPTLWLLLGAVTLVLLVACANIASLLLARAISRDRELALRVALGAGRARLVRQCLTESALVGLGGGALGVTLAAIGLSPFVAIWPGDLPRADQIQLDWRVLLFALAVSLASGVLFGLAPALRAPARQVGDVLKEGARTLATGSRKLHGAFVAAEIALALVLLACAGALGRTMIALASVDPGLDVQNVLIARTAISPSRLSDPGATRTAWQDLLDRARQVPGVEAIAMVDTVPMRMGNNQIGYKVSAAEVPDNQQPVALATSVTPDYLRVVGLHLIQGRFVTDQDRWGAQSVVVIDDVMARQAFGGADPIGRQVWIKLGQDPATVVGVVGHVRHWGLAGDDQSAVRAQLYYPFAQVPDALVRRWSDLMSIAVRTTGDSALVLPALRRAIAGDSRDQVMYEVRTLDGLASASIASQRFLLLLFGIFASVAVTLACIGVYGVLAYLTSQRLRELAVRMALGASAARVAWLVLRQSVGMIGAGVAIGFIAAIGAERMLNRLVVGMRPSGLLPMALTALLLVTAAIAASVLPARRASRVDPAAVLK
ncbi:MAG TPA: ABC transporter permease [Vicinamibacterales bacterium]|nr:ABC transporter permease [Vicinamibacterales bacterium]